MMENAKKIAIFGHPNPDWDCIGAMLGLWRLLEKQKKSVRYFVPNKPGRMFNFVKNIQRLKTFFDYQHYDLIIFLDFTWINRIEGLSKARPDYFQEKPSIVIDHHPDEKNDHHSIIIRDVKSISTCEILFEHSYKRRPHLYDKEIATYFYMGIASDSGNFLFEEDHIRTFTNVLKLLKLGADKELVVNNLIRKRSLNAIKFLQLLLNRIKQKGELLYTYYDETELSKYALEAEEAGYGLHIIQNIDGPQAVLLIKKAGDVVKGSLRAKKPGKNQSDINCTTIAKALWWWGHKLAAGFAQPAKGKFEQQIEDIVKFINKMIK